MAQLDDVAVHVAIDTQPNRSKVPVLRAAFGKVSWEEFSEMHIRKSVKIPVILASLVASMLLPASAMAESVCPPGFDLRPAPVASSGFWADRNGDGLQCDKQFLAGPSNFLIINIDNNVSDRSVLGVTEDGSTVLVNTDTGVVSP